MPRGVPKNKAQEMTEQELEKVETIVPIVGSLSKSKLMVEEEKARIAAQKDFPRIKSSKEGWISMTDEDVIKHQIEGNLIGHDPDLKLGLLKK